MKKVFLLTTIILNISVCFLKAQNSDSTINTILDEYISSVNSTGAGILMGVIDNTTDKANIYSSGMINSDNDLRLVCPASKPAITYMILNKNIDINASIDKWFPVDSGYKNSNLISIKMLLSNTSGIKDYVELLDKDLKCTPMMTVETAYKNNNLAFYPGDSVLYSNTGFNIAGLILEKEEKTNVDNLIKECFGDIASSIRMDDGRGNYPKGYPAWPYDYSQAGFAGGLIGNIGDYLKMMSFISNQVEFKEMTNWVKKYNGIKYGLGLFGQENIIFYHGNSGVNFSFLIKINSKIIYLHTTNELDFARFQNYLNRLISLIVQE